MISKNVNGKAASIPSINITDTLKKYQCEQCPKWFSRPSALQSHIYTHTGEKPYQCDISGCGRRFAVISNLRRHLRVHTHSNTRRRLSSQERRGYVQRLMERTSGLNSEQLDSDSYQSFFYSANAPISSSASLQCSTPAPYDNLQKLMPKPQNKTLFSSVKPACLTLKHLLNDE